MVAHPSEASPDQWRTENADQPTETCDDPKQILALGSWNRFLQAQAKLRAGSKIARHRDRNVAQRVNQFLCGGSFPGASGTLVQVLIEPGLLSIGEPFDQRFRKQHLRANVQVFLHTAPSGKADFRAARPR